MKGLILLPALPLISSFILAVAGRSFSERKVAILGTGSVGLVAILSGAFGLGLMGSGRVRAFTTELWTWMSVGGFESVFSLRLDPLSLVMTLVVTWIGLLIHVYSAEFMRKEEGYSRFFAAMNLFIASMLILVLADDLLTLFLGWEGVGLCSYLLIGFWYRDPVNGRAARKAFLVTRVGDVSMAIGLFLLFTRLGTPKIQLVIQRAIVEWPAGSSAATAAALLLLGGAVGKSAQLPLQTWLPDAMAGPTPVSALIHAATMVTAGVYLIARLHLLFLLASDVQFLVAVIGAVTLLIAAFSALTQSDIKRILAYSTISQIGYMFLALGVGARSAAIFHLVTHACFKALLFLAAGAVISSVHHEHNIFKMGGLRKSIPAVYWTFLAGAASLASLPFVTAGFYSKDQILVGAFSAPRGSVFLGLSGLIGAFLTALYTFRMVFVVFYGEARAQVGGQIGRTVLIPLIVLSIGSLAAGVLENPITRALGAEHSPASIAVWVEIAAGLASVAGIALAYLVYLRQAGEVWSDVVRLRAEPRFKVLHRFWYSGWGFDSLYDRSFVQPVLKFARNNRSDPFNKGPDAVVGLAKWTYSALKRTQSGNVRWYAACIAGGTVVLILLTEAV